jgi:hypothetical protein
MVFHLSLHRAVQTTRFPWIDQFMQRAIPPVLVIYSQMSKNLFFLELAGIFRAMGSLEYGRPLRM